MATLFGPNGNPQQTGGRPFQVVMQNRPTLEAVIANQLMIVQFLNVIFGDLKSGLVIVDQRTKQLVDGLMEPMPEPPLPITKVSDLDGHVI